MTSTTQWRKLAVVVEIPVRGKASENDLVYAVRAAISDAKLHQTLKLRRVVQTGTTQVKALGRVLQGRNKAEPNGDIKAIRLALKEISVRVSRLETATNPHRGSPAGDFD